jgi:hypothetical protein
LDQNLETFTDVIPSKKFSFQNSGILILGWGAAGGFACRFLPCPNTEKDHAAELLRAM